MLGFSDLVGSAPCVECGSRSGDCDWLWESGGCSPDCPGCRGSGVGRCSYCDEVVPCTLERGRNPAPDAVCAWRELGRLHASDCRWVATCGGDTAPLPEAITPYRS
jgi:hypothetical protein